MCDQDGPPVIKNRLSSKIHLLARRKGGTRHPANRARGGKPGISSQLDRSRGGVHAKIRSGIPIDNERMFLCKEN